MIRNISIFLKIFKLITQTKYVGEYLYTEVQKPKRTLEYAKGTKVNKTLQVNTQKAQKVLYMELQNATISKKNVK